MNGKQSIRDSGRRRTDFPCLWKREGRLKQRKRSRGCVYTFLSCWRGSVDIFIELKRKENSSERGELDMLMIFCEILQQHRLGEFRAPATLHWSTGMDAVALDVKQIPKQKSRTDVGVKWMTRSRPAEVMTHSPEEKRCRQRCFGRGFTEIMRKWQASDGSVMRFHTWYREAVCLWGEPSLVPSEMRRFCYPSW